jgi:hypothetical protein
MEKTEMRFFSVAKLFAKLISFAPTFIFLSHMVPLAFDSGGPARIGAFWQVGGKFNGLLFSRGTAQFGAFWHHIM